MKILEVEIFTSDLESTESFYSGKLGFPIISRAEGCLSFQAGNSTISFKKIKDLQPLYHFAFNIPCNQLKEGLSWIRERAELITTPEGMEIADFENWNAKAFYFFDNNGNILEFLARFDLKNESSQTFGHHSVISVSEIAIVTDNVSKLAGDLHTQTGINYFAKQPPHDNFTVMGNDEGLLILSLTDRHWFPTDIPSQKYPLTVILSEDRKVHHLTFNSAGHPGG